MKININLSFVDLNELIKNKNCADSLFFGANIPDDCELLSSINYMIDFNDLSEKVSVTIMNKNLVFTLDSSKVDVMKFLLSEICED